MVGRDGASPRAGRASRGIDRRYSGRVTSPQAPGPVRPVDYKGEPLDSERGPGLGCFRFQLGLLIVLIVLTPLTVAWNWPAAISIALLFLTLILLLFAGQTVIFLLRLVAADRRGRRRPLASESPTVGELEDAGDTAATAATADGQAGEDAATTSPPVQDEPPEP
jgi:hypothetical protein